MIRSIEQKYTEEEKKMAIDLLKTIDTLFTENNLKFYLAYGTLLGAVRHEGIIPWDDDMDIWIDYKDIYFMINLIKLNKDRLKIDVFVPHEHDLKWKEIKIYSTREEAGVILKYSEDKDIVSKW